MFENRIIWFFVRKNAQRDIIHSIISVVTEIVSICSEFDQNTIKYYDYVNVRVINYNLVKTILNWFSIGKNMDKKSLNVLLSLKCVNLYLYSTCFSFQTQEEKEEEKVRQQMMRRERYRPAPFTPPRTRTRTKR